MPSPAVSPESVGGALSLCPGDRDAVILGDGCPNEGWWERRGVGRMGEGVREEGRAAWPWELRSAAGVQSVCHRCRPGPGRAQHELSPQPRRGALPETQPGSCRDRDCRFPDPPPQGRGSVGTESTRLSLVYVKPQVNRGGQEGQSTIFPGSEGKWPAGSTVVH